MNIQVRVISAAALAQLRAVQAQSAATGRAGMSAAGGMAAVNKQAAFGLPFLSKWGNQVQWAGRQLIYNFTLPLAVAGGAATTFALENEKAFTRVEKVYGDNSKQFQRIAQQELPELQKAFEALSNQFGVHQAEVINIGADWAAAGASGIALAKSVKLTLETMILGEVGATEATKALIAIQAQFGLQVDDNNNKVTSLTDVIDILNMVENQTGASMKDLIDGLARSAGVARTAGVDIEHLSAMMAALVPATGSASTAGNGLKTILSRLLSPTQAAKDVMAEMGVEVNDLAWNSLNGTQRLERMAEQFETLSDAQKVHVSTLAASRWQINRFSVLMADITNKNGYYQKALKASSDEVANFRQRQEELQAVMTSNPQMLKQTWVVLQNAMAKVIVPLLPAIVNLAQAVAGLAQDLANMSPELQKLILFGLLFLALIGPIARYVGSVANLFGLLGASLRWTATHMGLLATTTKLADGTIQRTRGGVVGLAKSMFLFPFKVVIAGFKAVAAVIMFLPKAVYVSLKSFAILGSIMKGILTITRVSMALSALAFTAGLTSMTASSRSFGILSIFSVIFSKLVGIFKSGTQAAASVQLSFDALSAASTASSAKSRVASAAASARARLGIEGKSAEEMLGITAGATRAVEVNETVAAQRRAAIRAALSQYLATLAASMNAAIYGIEAGASSKLLALEAGTNSALAGMDASAAATRAGIHSAYAAFLLALWADINAQRMALEAGASSTRLAIESASHTSSLARSAAYYSADNAMRAAWMRYVITLLQAMNAARYGIETAAVTRLLAVEAGYQARRAAIAGAGNTVLGSIEAGGSATRLALTSAEATARVGIFARMWAAILAFGRRIGLVGLVLLMRSAVVAVGAAFASVPGLIAIGLAAALGVIYNFRDEIASAWNDVVDYFRTSAPEIANAFAPLVGYFNDIVQWIVDAFWNLPEGVRNAMLAVIIFVREAALQIYEWMSYLNPFATHSPSLVDSVRRGMNEIKNQYARAAGVGDVFAQAARDLALFKSMSASMGGGEFSEDRTNVAKGFSKALPLFDRLQGTLGSLNNLLAQQEAAVSAQQDVVDRWSDALERANDNLDDQQEKLDALQGVLSRHQAAFDRHADAVARLSSAPLKGMGAVEDKIFKNEMAQARLRLQILQTGEASRRAADKATAAYDRQSSKLDSLRDKLAEIKTEIDSHQQSLQDFANAPIKGMQKMSDAIFENEMAQRRLRLEMMDFEDANGSVESVRDTLAKLQGEIEEGNRRVNDLRAAGAGSEILGPMQRNLDALVAQRDALARSVDDAGITQLQEELDKLARAGERLELEQAIQFDPLTRQIDQLANAQKELPFDQIVAGINREQAAIDRLMPSYDKMAAAVEKQEAVVKTAAAARDAAVAAYDKEAAGIDKLQNKLNELQRQAEIMDLQKSIKFDPLIRQIDQLANAQKELSYEQIVSGIKRHQGAMDELRPKIEAATAAVKAQEQAVKQATNARDRVQGTYDAEAAKLDKLNEKYRETEQAIRDIEAALRDLGSIGADEVAKAKAKADKAKGAAATVPLDVETFRAGAGANFADVGGQAKIGREGGMASQADLLKEFTEQSVNELGKMFGGFDMLGPLKRAWSRAWGWVKENVGPVLADVGDAILKGWNAINPFGKGGANNSFTRGFKGIWDTLADIVRSAWEAVKAVVDLFAPDIKRIWDALVDAGRRIWNELAPELAKFGDLWEPIVDLMGIMWKNTKPLLALLGVALVGAFKILVSVISTTVGPVLDTVIGVVSGILRVLRGLIEFVVGVLTGDWKLAWKGIKDVFSGTIKVIVDLAEGLWDTLWGIVEGLVKGIVEFFKWLWKQLVGGSIVPDMINGIIKVFKLLLKLPKWVWDEILKPIVKFFKDLWKDVKNELDEWWGGIKKAWNALTNLDTWFYNSALKPLFNKVKDLWHKDVKPELNDWWSRIKNVWNVLTGLDTWFYNSALKPLFNKVKELWHQNVKPELNDWWARIKSVWADLMNLDVWFFNNVLRPVFNKAKEIWHQHIKPELNDWWGRLTSVWDKLKDLGNWFWKNVLQPIKQAFVDAFNGIREWFANHADRIVGPIKSVVRGIVSAINWVIKGINKLSELPGLDFHINEIQVNFAKGGALPERQVGPGFKTHGARAIVGEGNSNYPEYVIPTDPRYRTRAQALFALAGNDLGVPTIPQHADGGILGAIKGAAGKVKDVAGAGLDWMKGNIEKLASNLAMPLISKARGMIDEIDWKYGRMAAHAAFNRVIDWVLQADKVYKEKAESQKATMGGATVAVSDPGSPLGHSIWKGGEFTNRFIAHMKEAERIAGAGISVTQGGWRPTTSYSGTSHHGDALDLQVNYALIRGLRAVGIAAGDRTGLGNWAPHTHAIPGPAAGVAGGSAVWQWQDYVARGGANQAYNSPWGLANGAIIRRRAGGIVARLGEGRYDEAVTPLPRGWQANDRAGDGDEITELHFHGDLVFPNINSAEDAKALIENLKSLAGGAA